MIKTRESAKPVDRMVGRQVRMLRVSRSLSQSDLGRTIGVTFQQVQKYENGVNRISASKLYEIAEVLGVEVAQLFADAGDAEKIAAEPDLPKRIDLLIAHALSELPDGHVKEQLTALILALAQKEPAPADAV
jgi:transcriptional regulator with XRE-family HTH domain